MSSYEKNDVYEKNDCHDGSGFFSSNVRIMFR